MAAAEEEGAAPAVHFKRRKIVHPRRRYNGEDTVISTETVGSVGDGANDAPPSAAAERQPVPADEEEESVPNLKEILRKRKRPLERLKETARRAEERKAALAASNALAVADTNTTGAQTDQYRGRFVAQTGQFVDRDDREMALYVEARLAEQNYRNYGWPIPKHLEAAVAKFAPGLSTTAGDTSAAEKYVGGEKQDEQTSTSSSLAQGHHATKSDATPDRDLRMAAGLGKLQEIDLGPEAAARNLQRIEEARKRLEGKADTEVQGTDKDGKNAGKRGRRPQKKRNSEDLRRDALVEAVLREAKFDYFDSPAPPSSPTSGIPGTDTTLNADDALYESFRREFESQEQARNMYQRKPPATASQGTGAGGVKDLSKGPKLGGSRSARAAMHAAEKEAKLNKR